MSNPYEGNPYQGGPGQGGAAGGDPYGGNPYGGSPYGGGYGPVPQPHPQGTTVLVLGILGLVVCFICGIIALVIGTKALREIDANPSAYTNRQSVVIGRILGIVGVCLQVLGFIVYIVVFVAFAASAAHQNY